jgi:RNA polymerase sigma factor (sigma-70 family)
MPAPALRFEAPTFEPTFVASITNYVTVTCHRYRVRHADVEDVVQEALTKIVARIATFRPEKGAFDAWARGVALNVIRRYSRDANRHGEHFSEHYPNVDDYATHEPSPERCAQRKQAWSSISNAMVKLTAQQVNVLVSFDVHDMSHKEIGTKLNIPEAASHMCHKRAHKRLARCLDRELLSVMPPFLTGCNDPGSSNEFISSNEIGSRWTERSHYTGQVVAAILAFLAFVPSNQAPQMHASTTGEARVLGPVQNAVMYRSDERVEVRDEPAVHRDAPSGKPEPASLPSVRTVSAPTRSGDKQTYVQQPETLPPYKPTESTTAHLPPGR